MTSAKEFFVNTWRALKAFFGKTWVIGMIILMASIILLAQCAMTLNVASENKNPTEKDKENVRSVTIATLLVSLFFVIYGFQKVLCTIPFFNKSLVCNADKALAFGKNLLGKAAAAVSKATAKAAPKAAE